MSSRDASKSPEISPFYRMEIEKELYKMTTQELLAFQRPRTLYTRIMPPLLIVLCFFGTFLFFMFVPPYEPGPSGPGPKESKLSVQTLALEKVISCYYNTPSAVKQSQLLPQHIYPHLCTHINVAFAQVRNKTLFLDDNQLESLKNITNLKITNPNLKILISVGGSNNDGGFSEMVKDHASRKDFIKSIKKFLLQYSLDGVDLDWEFPNIHDQLQALEKRERQHFSQLLYEIRMEYKREKRDYLLTVAVASPKTIVDAAYDVDQLNLYTDYVNIMTYDFHFYSKATPLTGLNSPLYARPSEQLFMATLNINYTVNMYMDKGLQRDKIVVGIPTYGHTFTLMNPENTAIGSPAVNYGSLGGLGFVDYPEICLFWKKHAADITIHYDNVTKVPYMFKNSEWISFESPHSVMEKAKFIKENQLRGAMIYSLNADDYNGLCEGSLGTEGQFPLSQSVKNTLMSKN